MKKIVLLLLAVVLVGCQSTTSSTEKKKIGIIQIVDHPALNDSRQGFIDGLKEAGYEDGKNITIDYKNAAGDATTLSTIASKLVSDQNDLIFAIATPSAQAVSEVTQDIPILFTAVTDPVASKLVASMDKPGGNVSGTTDAVDIDKQFQLVKVISPEVKTIGVVYNTSEVNSQVQVDEAKKIATDYGYTIVTKGITQSSEISAAMGALIDEKVDAFWVPTDNMVVAAMDVVSDLAIKANIPVYGSEKGTVEGGALATDGIVYYELGKQTAKMAVQVLEGKADVASMKVESLENTKYVINETTQKALAITIPESIMKEATIVK